MGNWNPSELWRTASGEKIKEIKMLWFSVTFNAKNYEGDWVITHNELAEKFSELKEFVVEK
jgi:hypothetical protein